MLSRGIKMAIDRVAGYRVPERIWDYLAARGEDARYLAGDLDLNGLIAEIHRLHQLLGPPVPVLGDATAMLTGDWAEPQHCSAREKAVSRLVANLAAERADVSSFRSDPAHHVPAELVPWEALHDWITARSFEEVRAHRSQLWAMDHVELPTEYAADIERAVSGAAGADHPLRPIELQLQPADLRQQAKPLWLLYAKKGEDFVWGYGARAGGVLDRLRRLSQRLAKAYRWSEAQATVFCLTGLAPLIAAITGGEPDDLEDDADDTLPVLSRITLHVDRTTSPSEVAEQYARLRRWLYGERHRDLSEKHTQLALFAASEPKHTTWAARMARWNAAHADWPYTEVSNFSRDCLQAQRRLLGTTPGQRAQEEQDHGQEAPEQ
jgi:hypothetical protein